MRQLHANGLVTHSVALYRKGGSLQQNYNHHRQIASSDSSLDRADSPIIQNKAISSARDCLESSKDEFLHRTGNVYHPNLVHSAVQISKPNLNGTPSAQHEKGFDTISDEGNPLLSKNINAGGSTGSDQNAPQTVEKIKKDDTTNKDVQETKEDAIKQAEDTSKIV